MKKNEKELKVNVYFYPILVFSFFLTSAVYFLFPYFFAWKSKIKVDEKWNKVLKVQDGDIQNISKLQNADRLEDDNSSSMDIHGAFTSIKNNKKPIDPQTILSWNFTNKIAEIQSTEEKLVFEYKRAWSQSKPSFKVLSWWTYTNSWDKIIFPLAPLKIQFNKDTFLSNQFFSSWEILDIRKVNILPRFYSIYYKFEDKKGKIHYTNLFANVNQKSVRKKQYNVNLNFTWTSNIISFDYKIRLWTSWNFTLNSYKRSSDLSNFKLIWYTHRDNLDFDNKYRNLKQIEFLNWLDDFVYFDLSKNLELNQNEGLSMDYKSLPKNTWFILRFEEKGSEKINYKYRINFSTIADFKSTSTKDFFKSKKLNNYQICANQPLDKQKTKNSIEKAFWDNKISISFSRFESYLRDVNNSNLCLFFYYYTDPRKEADFSFDIFSLYWDSFRQTIHIWKYQIPSKMKSKDIVWDSVNIINSSWEFANKIQLTSNNYKDFDFYTRTCNIDVKNIIDSLKKHKEALKKYEAMDVLLPVLKCDNYLKQENIVKNFKYRKWHLSDFNTKNIKSNIFQASIWTWFKNAKTFFRTNLWILSKKSEDEIFVWINSLKDAKSLANVNIDFYWIKNEDRQIYKFSWKTDKNWFLKLKIDKDIKAWYLLASNNSDKNVIFLNLEYAFFLDGKYMRFDNTQEISKYQLWLYDFWWEQKSRLKAYVYSDRLLYKPWDNVFVSWWLREISWKSASWTVDLTLSNHDWFFKKIENIGLDDYWAFTWSFKLEKHIGLWNYEIKAESISKDTWSSASFVSYINVQEYKKSSFFVNTSTIEDKTWKTYLRIEPKYYFWWDLAEYNFNAWVSFKSNAYAYFDWFWCNKDWSSSNYCKEPVYYNLNQSDKHKSKSYTVKNYRKSYIDIPNEIQNKSFWNITYDLTLVDSISKEVLNRQIVKNLAPKYAIWFHWWSHDYIYEKNLKINLKWKLLEHTNFKKYDKQINWLSFDKLSWKTIKIKIYQKDFKVKMEKWPDNERYYSNWSDYKLIEEKEILVKNWDFSYNFHAKRWWDYFVRAIYRWYETQKSIHIYSWNNYSQWFYWNMKNNIKLDLNIKDKEYLPWDEIQLNINPYIKGAKAIISIEQWNKVKKTKTLKLNWDPLKLIVEKDWYPNVFVSVALIVGEDQNSKLSKKRPETRFFIWYAPVKLNKSMVRLKYGLKILDKHWNEKEYFQPNEKILLKIKLSDYNWSPQEARLSIWVIDKALLDIYDEMRKPIEYFYNMFWNYVSVFANYKNLYKSLRVFTADWTKWGWGWWDSWTIFNLRKNFLDTAYWNPAVYSDSSWNAQIEFKAPDNLTSWTIDIIWISKSDKMWVFRKDFKVNKDVMLQLNTPNFLNLKDNISIPYKLIVNNKNLDKNKKFTVKAYMKISNKTYDLDSKNWIIKLDLSSSREINDLLMDLDYISIFSKVQDSNWKIYDALKRDILVRKTWLMMSKFFFRNTNKIDKVFDIWKKVDSASVSIELSRLPVFAFEKAFSYLIHYPYWCTEQVISALYPILLAKDLSEAGLISSSTIKDWKIVIKWKDVAVDVIIENSLLWIYKHQKSNWWVWYWSDKNESSDPFLSVYTYWVIKQIQKSWHEVSLKFLNKLEKYIKSQTSKKVLLYFYLQKAFLWETIDSKFVLENVNNDGISKVLSYLALKLENSNFEDYKLKEDLVNLFKNKDFRSQLWSGRDYIYFSRNILMSYFIRSLNSDDAGTYVEELLNLRDKNWIRWYSTQENTQIIIALSDYIKKIKINKDISYKLKINDKHFEWKIWKNSKSKSIKVKLDNLSQLGKDAKISISTTSSEKLFKEIKLDYIVSNFADIKYSSENVNKFNLRSKLSWDSNSKSLLENISKASIGDKIDFIWTYSIRKNARKLAIAYYIPSNISIINPNLNRENYINSPDSPIRFEVKNPWSSSFYRHDCLPDHFELMFDRLFIYYDNMKSWVICELKFKWIKTHDWKVNIMPAKLFEMYNTQVRANGNSK